MVRVGYKNIACFATKELNPPTHDKLVGGLILGKEERYLLLL